MFGQMSSELHKVADDGSEPAAANCFPSRIVSFLERFLTYNAQDVICNNRQLQHEFVAVKLS